MGGKTSRKARTGPGPSERGAIIKPRGGRTTVALAYPNTYYVGMSNLGLQKVYSIINGREDALCERVFLPEKAGRDAFFKKGTRLSTVETGAPVSEFDIVAFSVSFENDYAGVAEMLTLSKLPPLSKNRSAGHPLVILGGICAFFNPEPLAPFFDAVLIGEAEGFLDEFLDAYEANKNARDKAGLLAALSRVPGVYVPSLYEPAYNPDGTLKSFEPVNDIPPKKVERRYARDLDEDPTHTEILTPDTEFSDMYMVELSRGCGRHCRFCMAGYVYRPPRTRGLGSVMADVERGAGLTKKIGLVGAAVSDYPHIAGLAEAFAGLELDFSASSLRADTLTPELVALVAKGNRTVAIAPEAGSERMRGVINKNITEDQILSAVRMLIEGGILNVKLYFMVGLPGETDEDVGAIIELSRKAREAQLSAAKQKGRIGRITVSVNCFIPKPWTPLQWEPMDGIDALNAKIRRIKKELKGVPNTSVIHDVPKWAYLQGALSRGDRRLAGVILKAGETGADWKEAFRANGLSMEFYAGRKRGAHEIFPWDFIDTGIKKSYLARELDRAGKACHTPPCNTDKCKLCGVC